MTMSRYNFNIHFDPGGDEVNESKAASSGLARTQSDYFQAHCYKRVNSEAEAVCRLLLRCHNYYMVLPLSSPGDRT
jgi:hypothetical protein